MPSSLLLALALGLAGPSLPAKAQEPPPVPEETTPPKKRPARPAPARENQDRLLFGESIRLPYIEGRIYKMYLAPGSPVAVQLPEGETVSNLWLDGYWFKGQSTPGSRVAVITAIPSINVVGKSTNCIIETKPLGLTINFVVECVQDIDSTMSPSWTFYVEGADPVIQVRRDALNQIQSMGAAMRDGLQQENEAWKVDTLGRIRFAYKTTGHDVKKVLDDGLQTWIFTPEATEQGSLKVVGPDKLEEVLTPKYDNGVYKVARVLRAKEKFVLSIGKNETKITLE